MADSVLDAVKKGRREGLVALRDRLAGAIDAGPDFRDLSGLVLRLERVLEELDGQGVGDVTNREDALAARRKAKKAASG